MSILPPTVEKYPKLSTKIKKYKRYCTVKAYKIQDTKLTQSVSYVQTVWLLKTIVTKSSHMSQFVIKKGLTHVLLFLIFLIYLGKHSVHALCTQRFRQSTPEFKRRPPWGSWKTSNIITRWLTNQYKHTEFNHNIPIDLFIIPILVYPL